MTSVNFAVSETTSFESFSTKGHSGYSEEGSDILCAAVSGATELVVNVLEKFSIDFSLKVDETKPYVLCDITQNESNALKSEIIQHVIEGYIGYISDLAESYPEYIEISTEV